MDFLCQSLDELHCKPGCSRLDFGDIVSNLFENNAVGVTNFSFEEHCAMTNADEANEVQENVVTAKKGKERGIKAITSFQVNNPNLLFKILTRFVLMGRLNMLGEIYIKLFCRCYQLLFQSRTPLLQSKPPLSF